MPLPACPTADHATVYLRHRARLRRVLAEIEATMAAWRAAGQPPAALHRLAPSVSLETVALLREAVVETLGRWDGERSGGAVPTAEGGAGPAR
jgi:hypothetical protein